jgi:hypothetical protein
MNQSMDPNQPQKFSDNVTAAAIGIGILSVVFGIAYGLEYWEDKRPKKSDRKNDSRSIK